MYSIFVAIIVFAGIWVIIFYLLPHALAGKRYFVRSIAAGKPRVGQIRLIHHSKLQIRKFFLEEMDLTEIKQIEGYLETTLGLEEMCCVDLIFNNGRIICFDGSKTAHQQCINQVLPILHARTVDWDIWCRSATFHKDVLYRS